MRTARAVFAVCLTIACGAALESIAAAKPQSPEYHLLKKVSLGGEGRWDYFEVEPGTHRVFIPRRTHIMVLDPEGKVLDDLKFPGMENAHGIVFAPELKRAFTTNGDDKSVTIFNPDTLKLIETVKLPDRAPDGILYDPASKRVFTQNDDPNADATAIDAKTGKVLGNIPLPDKAETAQADGEGHVYVNIEDKAEMTEFDSKTLKVLHTWPLAPCKIPTGLSINGSQAPLCGLRSGVVAVVDYTNGKVVATWPIGQGVDATRFDPRAGTQLVFASAATALLPWLMRTRPTATLQSKRSPPSPARAPWLSTRAITTSTPSPQILVLRQRQPRTNRIRAQPRSPALSGCSSTAGDVSQRNRLKTSL